MAEKKPKSVETEEVATTKQALKHGKDEVESPDDGSRVVETTEAVFEDVKGNEQDSQRGAHRAVFVKGEPRAADDE